MYNYHHLMSTYYVTGIMLESAMINFIYSPLSVKDSIFTIL